MIHPILESLHLIHTINPKTEVSNSVSLLLWDQWDRAMPHMEAVEVFACSKSGGRNFAGRDHLVSLIFRKVFRSPWIWKSGSQGFHGFPFFFSPKSHELPCHFGDSWIWCNRTLSWMCFFKFITCVWIFCLPVCWFFHDFFHFILCCATGRPVTRLRLGFPLVSNCGKVEALRNLWAKESSLKGWKMFFSRFPTESYPPTQGFGMFFYKALSRETWEFNEPNVVPVISGDVLSSNVEEPWKLRHGGMDWIMAWFG